jgi:hypothetical protein
LNNGLSDSWGQLYPAPFTDINYILQRFTISSTN